MRSDKKILIVDFMYLWNRIYAIKGVNTGSHIYQSLKHVNDSDYYDLRLVILDGLSSADGRRAIYPEYKSTRSDKSESYDLLNKFLKYKAVHLNKMKFLKNESLEADDLIAMFVKKYSGAQKYIYSGDTDLYQLLRFDNTYIGTNYSRGMIIEPITNTEAEKRYEKKYGLKINDVSDIVKCKTFKGDSSDNIPIACPGMRSATINTLIEKFWRGSEPLTPSILLNMAEYLRDNCKPAEFHNFYENRKAIIRNYKLVQLGYNENEDWSGLLSLHESGEWE